MTRACAWWVAAAAAAAAAVTLAAGCAPTRAPRAPSVHLEPERTEVRGDDRYRATAIGGDVVILAERKLGDASGHGDAVVRHATLEQALQSPHGTLAGARAWRALSARLAGAPAVDAAQHGLDELGRDHLGDYDGMAKSLQARDLAATRPDAAADLLRQDLDGRIAAYVRAFAGAVE